MQGTISVSTQLAERLADFLLRDVPRDVIAYTPTAIGTLARTLAGRGW